MLGRVTAYAAWGALVARAARRLRGRRRRSVPAVTLADDLAHADAAGADRVRPRRQPRPSPNPRTEPRTRPETEPEPTPTETEPAPEPTETQTEPEPEPEPSEATPRPTRSRTTPTPTRRPRTTARPRGCGGCSPVWRCSRVLVVVLVVRARRRGSWHDAVRRGGRRGDLVRARAAAAAARAGSAERLAGGWQVESARVGAVEDRLTGLEATRAERRGPGPRAHPAGHRPGRARSRAGARRTRPAPGMGPRRRRRDRVAGGGARAADRPPSHGRSRQRARRPSTTTTRSPSRSVRSTSAPAAGQRGQGLAARGGRSRCPPPR